MSEPLSSTEIEDVLSSIRRLVSDDMRPAARVAPQTAAAVEAGDKLILTPALRVIDTVEPGPGAKRLHLTLPEPADAAKLDSPSIGTVVASFGAAVDATDAEWEAENGDQNIVIDEAGPVQDWNSFETDDTLDATYAAENSAANGFDDEVLRKSETAIPGWAQTDDSGEEIEIPEPLQAPEPDARWVDAAEASVIAALAAQGKATGFDESSEAEFDGAGFDRAGFDGAENEPLRYNEDVLRELVRDVLREELAGKLGERITRNIRKLVRAEIARSLDTQDLS